MFSFNQLGMVGSEGDDARRGIINIIQAPISQLFIIDIMRAYDIPSPSHGVSHSILLNPLRC